ncbi:hypothetical protein B0H19DRAFT_1245980 [Mycena capillaripes]|nr:hypothetical protein B0H19DRAFT_1245980 [Mycena capillaripes]
MTSESTTDLCERIEQLSAAIELQKQVLRDLETNRINARRALNAIFMRCLPDSPGPDLDSAPMLLLGICQRWSDIAISTPSLWATIHSGCPQERDALDFDKGFEIWLSRAKGSLLSLHLCVALHRVFPLAKQHADHVKTLDLLLTTERETKEITDIPFPSLQKLSIDSDFDNPRDVEFDLCEVVWILRAAPQLSECSLGNMAVNTRHHRNVIA